MGGASSQEPRAVTVEEVEDDDGQTRINVTEDFLKYIRNAQSGNRDQGEARPSGAKQQQKVEEEDEDVPYPSAQELLGGSPDFGTSPWSEEADEVANMWKEKYESELRKNEELKHIRAEEFEKAVTNVKQKFVGTGVTLVDHGCENDRNSVLDCYRAHPGKPLECSEEVKAYFQCVEKLRKEPKPTAAKNDHK